LNLYSAVLISFRLHH